MRRRIYYQAFLKNKTDDEYRYCWFCESVEPDKIEELLVEIQTKHMNNRLIGGWRGSIPFYISWVLGEIEELDYSI